MPTCVPWELDSGCCTEWAALDPEVADRAEVLAWRTMSLLTAGRVGSCPVTVRPCLSEPCDWCTAAWVEPMIVDGRWVNHVCGAPRCSCTELCEIVMPGPVARIDSAVMDGITLDAALFRVDNGNRIVRQDGQCFPSCQRMDCDLTQVCTFGITYVPGIEPDAAGLWAAGVLACEFARACSGGKCRLPASVTTIARQGLAMNLSVSMFPDGMTGIREVDAYTSSINPNHLVVPPMVWSPDVPWAHHRYTTCTAPAPTP
jgi:hypothetical protein